MSAKILKNLADKIIQSDTTNLPYKKSLGTVRFYSNTVTKMVVQVVFETACGHSITLFRIVTSKLLFEG
jgi:hypothetical protein